MPYENLYQAYADDGEWMYRVLREYETPLEMRRPASHLQELSHEQLRPFALQWVGKGNKSQTTSEALHATTSLAKAKNIHSERRTLYSNVLCRWRFAAVPRGAVLERAVH